MSAALRVSPPAPVPLLRLSLECTDALATSREPRCRRVTWCRKPRGINTRQHSLAVGVNLVAPGVHDHTAIILALCTLVELAGSRLWPLEATRSLHPSGTRSL